MKASSFATVLLLITRVVFLAYDSPLVFATAENVSPRLVVVPSRDQKNHILLPFTPTRTLKKNKIKKKKNKKNKKNKKKSPKAKASKSASSKPSSQPSLSSQPSVLPSVSSDAPSVPSFQIQLINTGNNTDFDDIFEAAKLRWESVIIGDLMDIQPGFVTDLFDGSLSETYSGPVDDVVIGYEMTYIDGPGNILGGAGPVFSRGNGLSPISGIMKFDADDFSTINDNDAMIIILHEMGHVLGSVDTLYNKCNNDGCSGGNLTYACPLAQAKYNEIFPGQQLMLSDGLPGSFCHHWSVNSFNSTTVSELMIPFLEPGKRQPLTSITLAALDESIDDYVIDYSQADPFFQTTQSENNKWKVYVPTTTFNLAELMERVPEVKVLGAD